MSNDAIEIALHEIRAALEHALDESTREAETEMLRQQRDEWMQKAEALHLQLADARERLDDMEDTLESIVHWADAYPLEAVPVPDLRKCAALLEAGGERLDSVTAFVLRRDIVTLGARARGALRRYTETKSSEATQERN